MSRLHTLSQIDIHTHHRVRPVKLTCCSTVVDRSAIVVSPLHNQRLDKWDCIDPRQAGLCGIKNAPLNHWDAYFRGERFAPQ